MIGVFLAEIDDAYQQDIWRGMLSRARERSTGLMGFVGHRLDADNAEDQVRNDVYRGARRADIRGLILVTSALVSQSRTNLLAPVLSDLPLPALTIGLRVPGVPCLRVKSAAAMEGLVRHMIEVHGSRRFALVAGPKGHLEADERERAVRKVLDQHGLQLDPDLVVRGNFLVQSGVRGAQDLLKVGKPFDTLVCMNDRMALEAMTVFRQAGWHIPGDLRITGFDDTDDVGWADPPLTTVRQPLVELGRSAIDTILDLLDGNAPTLPEFSCYPVFRESCGCLLDFRPPQGPSPSVHDESPSFRRPHPERLKTAHSAVENTLDPDANRIEQHTRVSLAAMRTQAEARISDKARHELVRKLSSRLAGAFGRESMLSRLSEGLFDWAIPRAFLLLVDPANPGIRRLVLAHGPEGLDLGDHEVGPDSLLPLPWQGRIDGRTWVVEPLVYQAELLGTLILEDDGRDPSDYVALADQVASTLKGSLLLDQITRHEQVLEREVLRRTEELRTANKELKSLIARRQVLEREVQEISDKTMRAIGQDLHDDLCQHLAGIGMFVSVIEDDLRHRNDIGDLADSVGQVRKLVEDAVSRTKQIARGLYPPGLIEAGLVAAVEELSDSIERTSSIRILVEATADFRWLDPTQTFQLFRIIQESVNNSVRHSGSEMVLVRMVEQGEFFRVEVRDFGHGMGEGRRSGMGLGIMRFRAESIGAELSVEELDPGVCISCRMVRHG